jgi:hypothetical protein
MQLGVVAPCAKRSPRSLAHCRHDGLRRSECPAEPEMVAGLHSRTCAGGREEQTLRVRKLEPAGELGGNYCAALLERAFAHERCGWTNRHCQMWFRVSRALETRTG